MNVETLRTYLADLQAIELEINNAKRSDYANDEDVLQNFEITHIICKALQIEPAKSAIHVALFFVVHKIVRLANLTPQGEPCTPANEALFDTIVDTRLYTALMGAAIQERDGNGS